MCRSLSIAALLTLTLSVSAQQPAAPTAKADVDPAHAEKMQAGLELFKSQVRQILIKNCVDCHGVDGSGSMAPSFQDGRWHFGGKAGEVFESIYQGRPDGMPSWGGRITNDQIWMLTAYVRSLSSKDLSTENFSGKTVERTGH